MNKVDKISEKKQALIDAKNASPVIQGERVVVLNHTISDFYDSGTEKGDRKVTVGVIEVLPNNQFKVMEGDGSVRYTPVIINKSDIVGRQLFDLGADPFDRKNRGVRFVAFTLDSILFNLNILEEEPEERKYKTKKGVPIQNVNWNPFVYNAKGEKEYYQRPFVWTLEDKQLLIESIYSGIDCGKILIRKRSWAECEKMETPYWFDIVDGKQRLDAVRGFMQGEYPDMNGNFYADLTFRAQHDFTNHQLFTYADMAEDTPDENVIYQFLRLNFAGVPQSKEHIEFVKEISKRVGGQNA